MPVILDGGPSHPMSQTILLMFSGGIDSTCLLHYYLRETENQVHAHHVSIRHPNQRRWQAEGSACERIVAWCRENLRPFDYSTSRFDMDFPRVGWDSDLLLVVASKVALNLPRQPTTLALGWCIDDLERPLVRDREDRGVTSALWRALCDSVFGLDLDRRVAMPLAEMGLRKAQVIKMLPGELLESAWSCRTPDVEGDTPRPCGACHACELRGKATAEAAQASG